MKFRTLAPFFCAIFFVVVAHTAHAATSQTVNVKLVVPGCGDGFCDASAGESTTTCPEDCGTGQSTSTPTTTPSTPPQSVTSPSAVAGPAIVPNINDIVVSEQGTVVIISWDNPIDTAHFSGVRIVRSPYSIPLDPFDGKVIYQGSGTYTRDTGGVPGTVYYYTAFSYDVVGNYSSGAIFSVIWPGASNTTTSPTSPLFPIGSTFPPPIISTSSPIAVPTSPGQNVSTTPTPLSLLDISFVQDGRFVVPRIPAPSINISHITIGSVPIDGTMPLVVAVSDNAIINKIPDGIDHAIITLNILGKQESYLLRDNPTDNAFETRLDLSSVPAGGYPFVIEFWPKKGEPFAVPGLFVITTPTSTNANIFGLGITAAELWEILILFGFLAIFLIIIRRYHHQ